MVVLLMTSLSQKSACLGPGGIPQNRLGDHVLCLAPTTPLGARHLKPTVRSLVCHAWEIEPPQNLRNLPFGRRRGAARSDAETAQLADEAMVRGLFRALAIFRIATLVWAVLGVALSTEHFARPGLAWAMVALMIATTILLTPQKNGKAILNPMKTSTVLFELAIGVTVLVADGFVYMDTRTQSLPWSWPAAGIMAAGILFGWRAGLFSAAAISVAAFISENVLLDRGTGVVGAVSKAGLWILSGTLAGFVVTRLRRAEKEISIARAREEFARELHDGVLQTLAVIQRRSTDDELAALARDQEHDLRGFLAGSPADITSFLAFEPAMHDIAATHERRFPNCKVSVVVAGDLPTLAPEQFQAVAGAVGESLTNASKHGAASKVTIYAEPAEDSFDDPPKDVPNASLFVSVKDDGSGFDPGTATESIGMSRSIKGRMRDGGGRADVESAPGRGAEVQLWI